MSEPAAGDRVRIGILGCGKVNPQYMPNLLAEPGLEVVAVGDIIDERARATGDTYGVAVAPPATILANPDIDLIVNLTNIAAHVEVTSAALRAGHHVYSEKPLAVDPVDARCLVDEAADQGVLLGGAPDTLLGTGFQRARWALEVGTIGRPISAHAFMYRRVTAPPYGRAANPIFDMGPYYVTALVNLFGPAVGATAFVQVLDAAGTGLREGTQPTLSGAVQFAGLAATITLAWGTGHPKEIPGLLVHGTEGVIRFPNPNVFGEPAFVRRYGDAEWAEVEGSRQPDDLPPNRRGIGVAEMARSLRDGAATRINGRLAAHVVDILDALVRSGRDGSHVTVMSRCDQPPRLPTDALVQGR